MEHTVAKCKTSHSTMSSQSMYYYATIYLILKRNPWEMFKESEVFAYCSFNLYNKMA